jgi:predicted RNA-binding Zn ribbon-like protein
MSDIGVGADAAELAFRWRGGRVSLNFTATVGERWRGRIERLREPADLARWFVEAGLATVRVPVGDDDLAQARQLREALYRVFTAVRTAAAPLAADVTTIDGWAVRAAPGTGLRLRAGRLRAVPATLDIPGLLTVVARDGVDLVTGDAARRIRECAREDCALLFVDTSRAGARRWCAVDACGARSRMSAYRGRRAGTDS